VEAGFVIARIEDKEYRSDYERALATQRLAKERLAELEAGNRPEEISQAKAELAEAKVQLEKMAADLKRATDLRRRALISDEEFQDIESKHSAHRQRVDRLTFASRLMDVGPRQEKILAARAESAARFSRRTPKRATSSTRLHSVAPAACATWPTCRSSRSI
jgi:multidrug resistance efflux pump